MESDSLDILVERYENGHSTVEEERQLEECLLSPDSPEKYMVLKSIFEMKSKYRNIELEGSILTSLSLEEEDRKRGSFSAATRLQPPIAASIIFIIGFVVGIGIGKMTFKSNSSEIAQIHQELEAIKSNLILNTLAKGSSGEKLHAIGISNGLNTLNEDVYSALLSNLNHDPSINVRLEIIETLGYWIGKEEVQDDLLASILNQSSPMVVLTIANTLIPLRKEELSISIRKLIDEGSLPSEVISIIESRISQSEKEAYEI